MGLTDILNTARDAMTAQTFGLTVTGQNVSNVNTPGYVRRQALLETRDMGPGTFGGVNVAGIRRVADQFIDQRHLSLTGLSAEASARRSLSSAAVEPRSLPVIGPVMRHSPPRAGGAGGPSCQSP